MGFSFLEDVTRVILSFPGASNSIINLVMYGLYNKLVIVCSLPPLRGLKRLCHLL